MASSDDFETPRTYLASHRTDGTEFVTPRELSSARSSAFHTARELEGSDADGEEGFHPDRVALERQRAAMPFATPGLAAKPAATEEKTGKGGAITSVLPGGVARGSDAKGAVGYTVASSGGAAYGSSDRPPGPMAGTGASSGSVMPDAYHATSSDGLVGATAPSGSGAPVAAGGGGGGHPPSALGEGAVLAAAGWVASGGMGGTAGGSSGGAGAASGDPLGGEAVQDIFSLARHGKASRVQELMLVGVPADIRDEHGNTVLHIACQNGLRKVAKASLRMGCDINALNSRGNTPLHFCYAYGFHDLGGYLRSKGASNTIRNQSGLLPEEGIA